MQAGILPHFENDLTYFICEKSLQRGNNFTVE